MPKESAYETYEDISELRRKLEHPARKESIREVQDSISRLHITMGEILEIFKAASMQMKIEDREFDTESRKRDQLVAKLDKMMEQNRTIAEGLVSVVDMIREKFPEERHSIKIEASYDENEHHDAMEGHAPVVEQKKEPRPQTRPAQNNYYAPQQQKVTWQPRQEIPQTQMPWPQNQDMAKPPIEMPKFEWPSKMEAPSAPEQKQEWKVPEWPKQETKPVFPNAMTPPPVPPAPDFNFGLENDLAPPEIPAPDFNFIEQTAQPPEAPKKKGIFGVFTK